MDPESRTRVAMRQRVEDTIWATLQTQAQRFGWVDRENRVIDIGAIELSMADVAESVLQLFDRTSNLAVQRFLLEVGWFDGNPASK
jgi:hypothetical protein